uniref:WAP domain-containing protein n=1 Tax=Zosterops lateralis melanops TaxID=1220523 RepID=A0A8D2PA73_ZOSLA
MAAVHRDGLLQPRQGLLPAGEVLLLWLRHALHPPSDGQCVEECQADSQCPRGQRCTSSGCDHICMDIPGGRMGVCPIPREEGTCMDLCNFDEECPWGHKCCSNGCGHVCTPASLQGQIPADLYEGHNPWHGPRLSITVRPVPTAAPLLCSQQMHLQGEGI